MTNGFLYVIINKSSGDDSILAGVAQLVEQLICNQQVGSSSLSTSLQTSLLRVIYSVGFICGRVPERSNGADCKSVASASVVRIRPLPPNIPRLFSDEDF